MNQLKQKKEYYTNLFEHVMLNTDRVILINGPQKERNLVLAPFLKSDNKHNLKVVIKCSNELIRENIVDQILMAIIPNYYRGLDFQSKFKILENVIEDYAEKNTKLYLFVENIEMLTKDCQECLLDTIINLDTNVLHLIIESEPNVNLMGLVEDYGLSSRLFYYELESFAEVNKVTQVGHLSREASNDEYILDEIGNSKYSQHINRYAATFLLIMLIVPLLQNINMSDEILISNAEQFEKTNIIKAPVLARQADIEINLEKETAYSPKVEVLPEAIVAEEIHQQESEEDKGYSFIENTILEKDFTVFELKSDDLEKALHNTLSELSIEYHR